MRTRVSLALGILAAACGGEPPVAPPSPTDPTPAAVSLDQAAIAFGALGRQVELTATVTNAAGATLDVPVAWTHRVPGVAAVSATGIVVAMGNGVDTVIVTAGSAADTVEVVVAQVPVAIGIAGGTTMSALGERIALVVAVTDSNGRPVAGNAVLWSSSNPDALPVDSTGVVTAAWIGSAVITAGSGDLSGTHDVSATVTGPLGGPIVGAEVPCAGGTAGPFPCDGVHLLSYLPIAALGGGPGVDLNDLWGWTDPVTGDAWALVGRRDGIAFVKVTDPVNPRYHGWLPIPPGANPGSWHDVKVYDDHAFIVADGAGQHGMQVFDLTTLRGLDGAPATLSALTRYAGVASVHNIAINEETGFAYLVGANGGGTTCGGGLHMVNLQDPGTPVFAGCFADPLTGRAGTGYTHDVQCVVYAGPDADHAGRELCFGANETHLSIADVTVRNAPFAITRVAYPNVGYAHQGWLTPDHRYFFINDELDEAYGDAATTRTLIWDVQDLDDPVLAGEYFGPTRAIDHNHYVAGTRLYASNYQYGIRVLDVSTPASPVQIGHFDTAPDEGDTPGFGGSWSNYPFFPGGIVVVTSGDQGLFVLRVP